MKKLKFYLFGLCLIFSSINYAQTNLAYQKKATQSSNYGQHAGQASKAVDGNTSGNWKNGSLSCTKDGGTNNPWWTVDLGEIYDVSKIEIWNRTDCCGERLQKLKIHTKTSNRDPWEAFSNHSYTYKPGMPIPAVFTKQTKARYIRVKLFHPQGILTLAEVKVFGKKPSINTSANDGFLVNINGIQCIEAADAVDKIDEVYVDVYLDGKFHTKLGHKIMKPAPKNIWQNSWQSLFGKNTQNLARFAFAAREEFWLMPGAYYANREIRFDLWEKDLGKKAKVDPDDKIGSITIKATDKDNSFIERDFNKGGESGKWRIVCTKMTRKDYSTIANDNKKVSITIPIKNQNPVSACVPFSATAALAIAYQKKKGLGSTNEDLFDGFALYKKRSRTDVEGWFIPDCLIQLLKEPIPFKSDPNVKIQLKSFYAYHKDGRVATYTKAKNGKKGHYDYSITSKKDGNGLNKMRQQIKNGHALITRFDVHPEFMTYANYDGTYGGKVSSSAVESNGAHAVLVNGYTNPRKGEHAFPSWHIQNSWGPEWGKNGEFSMAVGADGIDEIMYKIGDFEIVDGNANPAAAKIKQFHFRNNSDWVSQYDVIFKKNGKKQKWNTGELTNGKSKMLQVYDNWEIVSVKAKYKDVFTWKVVDTKFYNKAAKHVSTNHFVEGRVGSRPKLTTTRTSNNSSTSSTASSSSNTQAPPALKKLYFKNTSAWVVKYEVKYKEHGVTKSWKTGDLAKGKSKMLQVYDNWDILSVRAEYKDMFTWRKVGTKSYNKQAKAVPQNHVIKGGLGSSPKIGN